MIVLYVIAGWCALSIAFMVLWALLMAADYENARPLRRRVNVKLVPYDVKRVDGKDVA